VQDVAHGSLLRSARQQLHAQIAETLEAHSPAMMENQPELFAQHDAEAGLMETSVAYWGKAGRRSTTRSAMAERRRNFKRVWTSWRYCPTPPNDDDRSSNFGMPWPR
jgi:predicted ATPase